MRRRQGKAGSLIEHLPGLTHGDLGHCCADTETLANLLCRQVLRAARF